MDEIATAAKTQQIEDNRCENSSIIESPYKNLTLKEAESYIEGNLVTTSRAYVATGYFLKRIRDDRLFLEDGYKNFDEYVQEKYGKKKDWASRCIKVNNKLSVGGDSPYLSDAYKGYTTYQLVELAYMTEEQIEQATPDKTVKQLREIRQPKETPYFPMPGQLEFEIDFPEIMPDPEPKLPSKPQVFNMDVSDMIVGNTGEQVAISQQPENTGLCMHRPEFPCTLPESSKNHPGDGTDCTHSCCWDCVKHGECKLECYASAQRPALQKEQQEPVESRQKAAEQEEKKYPMSDYQFREKQCDALARKMIQCWKPWFEQDFQNRVLNVVESEKQIKEKNNRSSNHTWYFTGPEGEMMHVNMFDDYIQFWGSECLGNCDWFYLCAAIQRMWQEMAMEEARKRSVQPIEQSNEEQQEQDPEVIDAEFTEIKPTDRYTPKYFLEKEKKLLEEMLEAFKDVSPEDFPQEPFAHKRIVVAALAAMVCDLENEEMKKQPEEEKPEQPELPVMRNNDQRKAFLDTFHDWPVWFRVPEASEVYYRYDLPDGTALVICEYQYWLEWRVKYGYEESPESVGTREYFLVPGYHYLHDCLSNRTTMIEKLKEIQKKG